MDTAIEQIKALAALFEENIAQYTCAAYDEANTRVDFIDKFFALLDWDVYNAQGFSEVYSEVVREDKVSIGGGKKAPDCSFRIGGVRKFFQEAKKPSINIKDAAEPAFQLRRYAYTAKLPLSILTNFAEFAVYDTRLKPNKNDSAGTARIFYCTYKEYEKYFSFLYNIFSKTAILKGSFDRYVQENKNKKGTLEVDAELLNVIEEWRMELAKGIALRNPDLPLYHLNSAVQKIIDRIIFLRIAEDKGIETENALLAFAKTKNIYEKLILIFKKADSKYNSGLFTGLDWIENLVIDDKILSNIIVNLYYPESPYEFSVLPVEILGSIYERFLGKTIRFKGVKDGHTAVIEEKPEVKKAGGVFYTPQYIVDYIVQNTVGEKIKNKSPEEIALLKICDPACGSGSFLVGAYQCLLAYYLDYYTQKENLKAALKKSKIYEAGYKSYKLAITEKQRILTDNIFGVDIDNQAVEVTKLSLYLKLLENENAEAAERLFKYSDMTLLPYFEENIKCGNSLIGTDFYAQGNLDLTDDERIKVNCFDWEKEFPAVFKNGGFEVIISNPPYVNAKILVDLFNKERRYLSNNYTLLHQKWDLYVAFLEKAIHILKKNGYVSMIVPYPFLNQNYGKLARKYFLEKEKLVSILDLSGRRVFKDAAVTNIVLVIQKDRRSEKIRINKFNNDETLNGFILKKGALTDSADKNCSWNLKAGPRITLDASKYRLLGDICFISIGMVLNADEKKAKGKFVKKDLISVKKTPIHSKRYTEAKNMDRYIINTIFYLEWNTKRVPAMIRRPTFIELYENKKIMINKLGALKAVYDESKIYCDQTIRVAVLWKHLRGVENGSVTRYLDKERAVLEQISEDYCESFLLGILNARLGNYLLDQIRGIKNIDINPEYLKSIPIPVLDMSQKADKAAHDRIVSLVDKMLELKGKEAGETNPDVKKIISRQIESVDRAIDAAAYALYGLTADEIRIVEEK